MPLLGKDIMNDTNTIEELVAEGWTPADSPPDTNRIVQIAYDDGSTGPNCKGFFDEVQQIPPTGVRLWWDMNPYPHLYPHVLAWKDIPNAAPHLRGGATAESRTSGGACSP